MFSHHFIQLSREPHQMMPFLKSHMKRVSSFFITFSLWLEKIISKNSSDNTFTSINRLQSRLIRWECSGKTLLKIISMLLRPIESFHLSTGMAGYILQDFLQILQTSPPRAQILPTYSLTSMFKWLVNHHLKTIKTSPMSSIATSRLFSLKISSTMKAPMQQSSKRLIRISNWLRLRIQNASKDGSHLVSSMATMQLWSQLTNSYHPWEDSSTSTQSTDHWLILDKRILPLSGSEKIKTFTTLSQSVHFQNCLAYLKKKINHLLKQPQTMSLASSLIE